MEDPQVEDAAMPMADLGDSPFTDGEASDGDAGEPAQSIALVTPNVKPIVGDDGPDEDEEPPPEEDANDRRKVVELVEEQELPASEITKPGRSAQELGMPSRNDHGSPAR